MPEIIKVLPKVVFYLWSGVSFIKCLYAQNGPVPTQGCYIK